MINIRRPTISELKDAAIYMREMLDAPSLDPLPPIHELIEVESGWFSNGRCIATMETWELLQGEFK